VEIVNRAFEDAEVVRFASRVASATGAPVAVVVGAETVRSLADADRHLGHLASAMAATEAWALASAAQDRSTC
jgi:hypothetical protein